MSRFAEVPPGACELCAVAAGARPELTIARDDGIVAFVHPEPATAGHLLVLPVRHSGDLLEIDAEDLCRTTIAAQGWARRARRELGCAGVNLINACGAAAGQTVPHFHLHVVPRYPQDGMRPPWIPRPGEPARLQAIASRLRGTA